MVLSTKNNKLTVKNKMVLSTEGSKESTVENNMVLSTKIVYGFDDWKYYGIICWKQ